MYIQNGASATTFSIHKAMHRSEKIESRASTGDSIFLIRYTAYAVTEKKRSEIEVSMAL